MDTATRPNWPMILEDAVNRPGSIASAFRAFHSYSFGNQMLAAWQCYARGIAVGPIATYKKWLELGRQVRKGEKAIELWMPIGGKKEDKDGNEVTFHRFMMAKKWFVLTQTDGEDVSAVELPQWYEKVASGSLGLREIPFDYPDGNTLGYCRPSEKVYAINPVAPNRIATVLHEFAHAILHTDEERIVDGKELDRHIKEMEAECTALLCLDALGFDTTENRGYVQNWFKENRIPDANASRIMKAADTILKAGEIKE